MANDVEYKASLDDDEVLKGLNRIERAIKDTAKAADRGFGDSGKSAVKMGASIGGVAGIVQSLTQEFIQLAGRAAGVLAGITAEAIELNKEAELTRISVTNIFGGNEAVADAFLQRVKETATLLGANRQELQSLAKGILPDIGDIDTTIDFLESITILGRDAGQSFQSIRIAAEEALSGNLSSLQRRLNIPKSVLDSIERYAENMSFADAVAKGLQERVEATGLSAEATADSLAVVQGQFQSQLQDLQIAFGSSPANEFKEQLLAIGAALRENNPEIEDAAVAIGDLLAVLIDFAGTEATEFLESIDFAQVELLVDEISRAVNNALTLIDVLAETETAGEPLERLTQQVAILADAFEVVAQKAGLFKAGVDAALLAGKALADPFGASRDIGGRLVDRFLGADDTEANLLEQANNAMEAGARREEQLAEAKRKRKEETAKATQAEIDAAEADLKAAKAAGALAEATSDVADKEAALAKKREDAAADSLARLVELEIRQGEARTEAAIRQAEDRVLAELDAAQEIESIRFKFGQDLANLEDDLPRETAKINRDFARKRADIDRDSANERIQIERDYQQELRRIQSTFAQSAQEAAFNVDAQAFRRAQTERDNAIVNAGDDRGNRLEDAKQQAQQQREALKVELANELEDAKQNHREKIQALQERLNDELEMQAFKQAQENERQAVQDALELERLARQQALELERFERAEIEKQARLERSLENQVKALEEAKLKELEITEQIAKLKADTEIREAERSARERARIAAAASASQQARANASSGGRTPSGLGGIPILHDGGFLGKGQTALVEAGERFFTAPANGVVVPQSQFSPAASLFGGGGSSSVTNNNTVNAGLTPEILNSPEMMFMVERMVNKALGEIL